MVDSARRDWVERSQAYLEEADGRRAAYLQAQDYADRLAEAVYREDGVAAELERRAAEVEASEAQERVALRPMLSTVLDNLRRLREAWDSHRVLLAQRQQHLRQTDPRLQSANEKAAAARAAQLEQLEDLATEYSRLLGVAHAADAAATEAETRVLDELAAKDEGYRAAREDRVAARRAMANLVGAISNLQEGRTEQVRCSVAGLDLLWAKPAERTVGLSPAEAAKAYPALAILLDVRKERSSAPQVRITPAGLPPNE